MLIFGTKKMDSSLIFHVAVKHCHCGHLGLLPLYFVVINDMQLKLMLETFRDEFIYVA